MRVIRLYCKKLFPDSDIGPTERYVPDNYLGVAEFRFFEIKLDVQFTVITMRRTAGR